MGIHMPKPDFRSIPDDVIQAYRFFLGRDPESSQAIQGRLEMEIGDFLQLFVTAQEFLLKTLKPLADGFPLPHAFRSVRPEVTLKRWAAERLPLDPAGADAAENATTWQDLLLAVLTDQAFLRAVPAGYDVVITRSTRQRTARALHAPALGEGKEMIGNVEYNGGTEISGWAANARDLQERIFLEFHIDALYIGAVQCGLYRRELAESLGSDGQHGFLFSVPASSIPLLKKGAKLTILEAISKQRIARDLLLQYDDFDFSDFASQVSAEIRDLRAVLDKLEASLPVVGTLTSLPLHRYGDYHQAFYTPTARQERLLERLDAALPAPPCLDIGICVGPRVKSAVIGHTAGILDSLIAQVYGNWTATVVLEADVPDDERAILQARYANDARIVIEAAGGALAGAEPAALLAHTAARTRARGGGWIGIIDEPLRLSWDALSHVARAAARGTHRLIYGDHDTLRTGGDGRDIHADPVFKSAFDYQLLLSWNIVGGLFFMDAGCFDSLSARLAASPLPTPPAGEAVSGVQAHDLLLAFAELYPRGAALHLPRILHHLCDTRPADRQASRRSVERHLARRGIPALVESTDIPDGTGGTIAGNRVVWPLSDRAPSVTVIIPTKDKFLLVGPCFESLLVSRRSYPGRMQIIIVDHESTCQETVDFLNRARAVEDVMVIGYVGAFNWSAINNLAARQAQGDVLVFLNNDMTVINHDWCSEIAACAMLPEVGAVGAQLLYEDGTIQHAGVVVGVEGGALHEYSGELPASGGYLGRTATRHSAMAVTGACLATRRELFIDLGGFDAMDLKVTFNDVDYCLNLCRRGFEVIYTPYARFYHFESKSRGFDMSFQKQDRARSELETLRRRWPEAFRADPFYNAHFSRHAKPFQRLGPPSALDA